MTTITNAAALSSSDLQKEIGIQRRTVVSRRLEVTASSRRLESSAAALAAAETAFRQADAAFNAAATRRDPQAEAFGAARVATLESKRTAKASFEMSAGQARTAASSAKTAEQYLGLLESKVAAEANRVATVAALRGSGISEAAAHAASMAPFRATTPTPKAIRLAPAAPAKPALRFDGLQAAWGMAAK